MWQYCPCYLNRTSYLLIKSYCITVWPIQTPCQTNPIRMHPTPPLCTAVMLFDRHADGPYLELIKKAFSPSHPVIRHHTYDGNKVTKQSATYAILRFDDVCVFMWVCVCLYVCATRFVCVYQVVWVCLCVYLSGIDGSRSKNLLELLNHLQYAIAVLPLIQHAAETGASAGVDRQLAP